MTGAKRVAIFYDLPRPYALEAAVGASGVVEIIFGEPYGVTDVVAAVGKRFPGTQDG